MQGPVATTGSGLEQLELVLSEVVRETDASVGLLYLLPPGEEVLRLALLTGVPQQIMAPWARVRLGSAVPVADAVREGRLVWVGSQEELARRYPGTSLVLPHPFALAAAPISDGPTDWGCLALGWPGSRLPQPTPHERDAMQDCCRRLGLLLHSAAGMGRPVLPGAQPRMLPPPRSRAPEPAVAAAAADFAERLPGGCCALDEQGRFNFVSAAGAELMGTGVRTLLGALPRQVLPWLDDPVFEDRYRAAVISRESTSCSVLKPPDRWLSFHMYPDAHGVSIRIIPADTDEAPDSSALLRPTQPASPGRATALYYLVHLAATLTEALGVRDVVEQVTDQIMPAFRAQALALMVTEEGRLKIIGHRGYTPELMALFDAAPLTSNAPAAHVLTTGIPRFFAGFAELKRAYPNAVVRDGKSSWAFLPLIASGRGVGSLVLAYDRPHTFAEDERSILTALAGLIAQALDRARLYDSTQDLAHSLQASLLPQALPHVPGLKVVARYLPATRGMDIGGDFYDVMRTGPATTAVTIGDVQGHSVNAAALMGQVRTAVHATTGAPPGEVLSRTNRLLTDLDPGLFTSCLHVCLDLARHKACLATAGHPPPLLRHADGRTEVIDLPAGLLLGIDPGAEYVTKETPLPPGSVLVLYTDGLVEAPGTDPDEAITGLVDELVRSGHQPIDALADTLVHHATLSTPRSDDLALLLVQTSHGGQPSVRR
ncbi:hypothetical protein GCM10018793_22740 [Streptomyces sulfonofaciens]|uniref:protein-serine/threonine phosphatase n=1 Tax=Streptomyces sulfonofaciens TaxID=68272 RepID=A0A919G1X9_9ACTN|nr:SpoIIE family protein phosphatase [Streptomyces sulfonofaciens]GHH76613.1 hypothetical protein GCM10018793_22740 [Streptomyces sulfonofaciens]